MRLAVFVIGLVLSVIGGAASAQQRWIQIEAQPSLREGEERARAYAGVFPNVNGFVMTTGWHAIALGPYPPEEAERQLRLLKGERLIPGDSYIAFGDRFGRQFWPAGASTGSLQPEPGPEAQATDDATETDPMAELPLPEETPAEARRSEALLTGDERRYLQEALQWDGFYTGAIDGAFGAGTRRSMAAWQAAMGYDPTGILTTTQRLALTEHYQAERAALGLRTVTEEEAQIEIPLPLALVEFDRYQPPFAQYREKDGSGFRVLLISQQGDQATLNGLYDVMQTLEIVPVTGERGLNRTSFVLTGKNDEVQSHTEVQLSGGLIKGFTLVWPPADGRRATKVLDAMRAGFRPLGDSALDDSLGEPLAEDRAGLMAGLEIRRPDMSRSGFWLNGSGLVATTAEAVGQCDRITLGTGTKAVIAHRDAKSGIAILKPETAVAPRSHARLATRAPRIGAEIAVAGFPYEDALDTAVLTFGLLADTRGLEGDEGLNRLTLSARDGDAGAPVIDGTGQVIGILMPHRDTQGRILPDDVGIAVDAATLRSVLSQAGFATDDLSEAQSRPALAPEDLTRLGRDMAVRVSCWN